MQTYLSIVCLLIKPYYGCDSKVFKYLTIIIRSELLIPFVIYISIEWTWKSHKFPWNNPIHIPIINLLIKLILFHIKSLVIIPFKMHSYLKPLQTIKYCAFVCTDSLCCISERFEIISICFKFVPYLFCCHFKANYRIGSDQYSSICLLFFICTCIVVNFCFFVFWILNSDNFTVIKFSSSFTNLWVLPKSKGPKSLTKESYFRS